MLTSLDSAFFERMYAEVDDPWGFASRPYEMEKYASTIGALPPTRFARAFEIGCSVGVLTRMLASHCETLLSVDVNDRALRAAGRRCSDLTNVTFETMSVPDAFPTGNFDLIVLSEVGYYWSEPDLRRAIDRIASAAAGGVVVLVHYLPKVPEYPSDGDSVHRAFLRDDRFRSLFASRTQSYRIDVLRVREAA